MGFSAKPNSFLTDRSGAGCAPLCLFCAALPKQSAFDRKMRSSFSFLDLHNEKIFAIIIRNASKGGAV
jgi:hypothetical protein